MQRVKDLTIDEFKAVVGQVVEEKLRELLADPDTGLTLRPEIEARLAQQLQDPQRDGESILRRGCPSPGFGMVGTIIKIPGLSAGGSRAILERVDL